MTKSKSASAPSAKVLKFVFLGLALVAIVLVALWRWNQQRPVDYSETVFEPYATTLAPGVHMLGELSPGAAYVVETKEGLVLIDTGLHANATLVASQLSDLGLEISDLHIILITHVHGDHSLGAQRLRQLTGATIYAGAGDSHELQAGGPRDAFFSTYSMPGVETHATEIDHRLEGGEKIELGDASIHCIATPGHTPGSFCFLLERDGQRILFTGDTISSLTSELGTYAAHLSPRYRGSADDYLASLENLKSMPAPDLVLPGHPRMDRVGQSPRMSKQQWHALLDRGIDEMHAAIGRFEADGRDFLDGQAKSILPGLYYLGDYHDWAVYCLIKDDQLFVFDAPGEPGYRNFIQERLQQLGVESPPLAAVLLTAADEAATRTLSELVIETHCSVVMRAEAQEEVRQVCPPDTELVEAESLGDQNWFTVKAINLGGVGKHPVAYLLTWQDNTVLISGRLPTRRSASTDAQLTKEIDGRVERVKQFFESLDTLRAINPDIWLPARPVHGQNANLYDEQWPEIISANRGFFPSLD